MLITFEGPEGCGKSTHSRKLKVFLEELGHKVLLTQEPGGTVLGKQLRQWLLGTDEKWSETTELFLFAADRAEHVQKIILPALSEGKIVLCDRFIDSTLAYQVGGRGLPEDLVRYVNMVSSQGLLPEMTLLLDVLPEEGLRRACAKRPADRFEKEKIEFHQRVRQMYLQLAQNNPQRVCLIDTLQRDITQIQVEIRQKVRVLLK